MVQIIDIMDGGAGMGMLPAQMTGEAGDFGVHTIPPDDKMGFISILSPGGEFADKQTMNY